MATGALGNSRQDELAGVGGAGSLSLPGNAPGRAWRERSWDWSPGLFTLKEGPLNRPSHDCPFQGPWEVSTGEVIGWSEGGARPLVNSRWGSCGPCPQPLGSGCGFLFLTCHNSTVAIASLCWPLLEGVGQGSRARGPLCEAVTARHYINVINNPLSLHRKDALRV